MTDSKIETFVEADFVPVTTNARKLRHWALKPRAQWHRYSPLCNTAPLAMDQAQAIDAMPTRWRKRIVIADMPACRQCEKSKARRLAAVTPPSEGTKP